MASRNFEKEAEECINYLMTILKNDLVGKEYSDDSEAYEAMCLKNVFERIDHNLIRGILVYKVQEGFKKAASNYFDGDRKFVLGAIEGGSEYINRRRLIKTEEGCRKVLFDIADQYENV